MKRIYLKQSQYQANGMPLPNSYIEYVHCERSEATHHADYGDDEEPEWSSVPPRYEKCLRPYGSPRIAAGV